jgi:hypothetical protein
MSQHEGDRARVDDVVVQVVGVYGGVMGSGIQRRLVGRGS